MFIIHVFHYFYAIGVKIGENNRCMSFHLQCKILAEVRKKKKIFLASDSHDNSLKWLFYFVVFLTRIEYCKQRNIRKRENYIYLFCPILFVGRPGYVVQRCMYHVFCCPLISNWFSLSCYGANVEFVTEVDL